MEDRKRDVIMGPVTQNEEKDLSSAISSNFQNKREKLARGPRLDLFKNL